MTTSYMVDTGSLRLHILDWGGNSQSPLFLLHGLGSSSHMFDLIAPALTMKHRVFAVDQRGHGLSDKPDDGYDFETIAHDIDQLADALGYANQPISIIGHSWGANTTLYYAATRPARTTKAVLIDGGIRVISDLFPTWADAEVGMAPPSYVNKTIDDIKAFIRKWQGDGYRPQTEPLALTIFDLSDPNHVHPHLSRDNNMKIARVLWEFQPTDFYAHVQCPLLIVNAVGFNQEIAPDMAGYAADAQAQVPNVQMVWMRDTIHDIPWQRPQELIAVLDTFL